MVMDVVGRGEVGMGVGSLERQLFLFSGSNDLESPGGVRGERAVDTGHSSWLLGVPRTGFPWSQWPSHFYPNHSCLCFSTAPGSHYPVAQGRGCLPPQPVGRRADPEGVPARRGSGHQGCGPVQGWGCSRGQRASPGPVAPRGDARAGWQTHIDRMKSERCRALLPCSDEPVPEGVQAWRGVLTRGRPGQSLLRAALAAPISGLKRQQGIHSLCPKVTMAHAEASSCPCLPPQSCSPPGGLSHSGPFTHSIFTQWGETWRAPFSEIPGEGRNEKLGPLGTSFQNQAPSNFRPWPSSQGLASQAFRQDCKGGQAWAPFTLSTPAP